MAQVLLDDDPDIGPQYNPGGRVGGSVYAGTSGPIDVGAGVNVSDVERQLREMGGGLFDQSDLEGVLRNTGYNQGGVTLDQALANARSTYDTRRKNTAQTGGGGGASGYTSQFDDASTRQLEDIAKAQMGEVRSNPDLDSLLGFLRSQFSQLSTNPGYSNEDLALLNTQAFEPIEARRTADQKRVLERTAARGMLPSSGLTEELAQSVDQEANRQRTVAGRELGINAINQRRADLNQAVQLGSMLGLDIPKGQRSEELALSQLLYQLPRNSLQDLMMVLNGSSSPNDLYAQTLGLTNQNMQLQQQNDANNAALMSQIGQILAGLFR